MTEPINEKMTKATMKCFEHVSRTPDRKIAREWVEKTIDGNNQLADHK